MELTNDKLDGRTTATACKKASSSCLGELTNRVGKQVNYEQWSVGEQTVAAEVSSSGSSAVPEEAIVATLGDHSKPLWTAQMQALILGSQSLKGWT